MIKIYTFIESSYQHVKETKFNRLYWYWKTSTEILQAVTLQYLERLPALNSND